MLNSGEVCQKGLKGFRNVCDFERFLLLSAGGGSTWNDFRTRRETTRRVFEEVEKWCLQGNLMDGKLDGERI
jgi:hypothetical protein